MALTGCRSRLRCRQDTARTMAGWRQAGMDAGRVPMAAQQKSNSSKRRKGAGQTLFPAQDVSRGAMGTPGAGAGVPHPFPVLWVIVMQRAEAVPCP